MVVWPSQELTMTVAIFFWESSWISETFSLNQSPVLFCRKANHLWCYSLQYSLQFSSLFLGLGLGCLVLPFEVCSHLPFLSRDYWIGAFLPVGLSSVGMVLSLVTFWLWPVCGLCGSLHLVWPWHAAHHMNPFHEQGYNPVYASVGMVDVWRSSSTWPSAGRSVSDGHAIFAQSFSSRSLLLLQLPMPWYSVISFHTSWSLPTCAPYNNFI